MHLYTEISSMPMNNLCVVQHENWESIILDLKERWMTQWHNRFTNKSFSFVSQVDEKVKNPFELS